ncbi:MBL fold metallo-hydrolase [Humibacter sp. BT305]|uniref:MBL fold metallo-hydrolase n=1 Tax=Cnuibacter physcomitrellae TaxID=1619308 RepID=A0A1X9LNM8_9MICO|nr:MBL fold metallo-hydrolase [Cnuibacter physcomitrellae]ARJ05888.1 MBL fold metallo-hydrolase [Cnuibacter physcomitrellae]AXH35496.1 MBL fold metallo-hydrolase [Humibacter sp. BT305]GGI36718.1 MBL fold metallo-hydrolase [Cnuibacter physcomitrellae]
MRLTKFEHAALQLEQNGRRLFIDPGVFTTPITEAANAVAVVITHEHPDHWTPDQLKRIVDASPDVTIYGPAGVVAAASDFPVVEVRPGEVVDAAPFSLRFFGGRHAVIHTSIPVVDNVGVIVNDSLFYPGDSFADPAEQVDLLAVPVGAPWLKISESIDYVLALKPKRAFATHEMVLSVAGKQMGHDRLRWATEQAGGEYVALEPGDTLDV